MDTSVYDGVFFTGIGTLVCGLLLYCVKYAYKIKIRDCSFCWNCLEVNRDVEDEIRVDMKYGVDNIPPPSLQYTPQRRDTPT